MWSILPLPTQSTRDCEFESKSKKQAPPTLVFSIIKFPQYWNKIHCASLELQDFETMNEISVYSDKYLCSHTYVVYVSGHIVKCTRVLIVLPMKTESKSLQNISSGQKKPSKNVHWELDMTYAPILDVLLSLTAFYICIKLNMLCWFVWFLLKIMKSINWSQGRTWLILLLHMLTFANHLLGTFWF